MSTSPAAIVRQAIIDVLEGKSGVVRRVATDLFGYASFNGQSVQTQFARIVALEKESVFDVQFKSAVRHPSSPMSSKASFRNDTVPIDIMVWTQLRKYEQDDIRDEQRAEIENDRDTALQALTYPGNLTTTIHGVDTNIIGGLLQGPDGTGTPTWEVLEEDWGNRLLRSVIRASAVIVIPQPVS